MTDEQVLSLLQDLRVQLKNAEWALLDRNPNRTRREPDPETAIAAIRRAQGMLRDRAGFVSS